MNPKDKRRIKQLIFFVVCPILYICSYGFFSVLTFVSTQPYRQSQKFLVTDGSRLFAGTNEKTYKQEFVSSKLTIDGKWAGAWVDKQMLKIQIGDQVITCQGVSFQYLCWSPPINSLFFLDSGDKSTPPKRHIWRWSRADGFARLTKEPQAFFNLTVSRDGQFIDAFIYGDTAIEGNSLFSCTSSGGKPTVVKYGNVNFTPVRLEGNSYLVEVEGYSPFKSLGPEAGSVYRWKPKTEPTPFKVGDRTPRSVRAINGAVWVLFQEPVYSWHLLMVKREPDAVTVARLSNDLKRVDEEIALTSEE